MPPREPTPPGRGILPSGKQMALWGVLLFVVTVVAGYFVMMGVLAALPGDNVPSINTVLKEAPWGLIIFGSLVLLCAMVPLNGLRWGHVVYVLSGTRPSLRHSSVIFTGAATTNIIIPGVFGELLPGIMLHSLYGLPVNIGLAAQLYTRIVAITTYAVAGGACWLLMPKSNYDPLVQQVFAYGLFVISIPSGFLLAVAFAPNLVHNTARFIVRHLWPSPKEGERRWLTRIRYWIIDMGDTGYALHTLIKRGSKALLPNVLITLVMIGCYAGLIGYCAWIGGHRPNPLATVVVVVLNQFAALAALIMPLGVGGQEIALTAMGPALVGPDWGDVARFALTVRLSMNFANILGIPLAVESLRYIKMDDAELERYRQTGALKLAFESATADPGKEPPAQP